ncbi:hypothetical protein EIN_080060 [Entamoeba invadens IP1]|uniref:Uncharacterized protein n=1 Tax=Entamoeba invadens TaxID=33085 RepID=S0B8P8_ENTIV|nr:hypothetical protein EIN_080060 [Entamoeba invadens IP1]ELP85054.1 hypothetical protein EIN_080060 [Entamoeba invadens IP1]BAN42422.1 hypothetical protein [Entamoeba invadens]|eukprot:XP_004184400.1 hypothetical protein EIN_080060 [Entamoeba invadens IP1]
MDGMFDVSNQVGNVRKFPVYDPTDSTPILEGDEPYHLKLCFCPLCQNGMTVLAKERTRNVISWQYICKVIFYCLSYIHKDNIFFSLKYDAHWFVTDHWYLFSQLPQFRTNPNKWKKSILDAMIHCNSFESGKSSMNKTGVWKLKIFDAPWENKDNSCAEEFEKMSMDTSYQVDTNSNSLPSLSALFKTQTSELKIENVSLPYLLPNDSIPSKPTLQDFNSFLQSLD